MKLVTSLDQSAEPPHRLVEPEVWGFVLGPAVKETTGVSIPHHLLLFRFSAAAEPFLPAMLVALAPYARMIGWVIDTKIAAT